MLHMLYMKMKDYYPFSNKVSYTLFFSSGIFFYIAGFSTDRTLIEWISLHTAVILLSLNIADAVVCDYFVDYFKLTHEEAFKLSLVGFPLILIITYYSTLKLDYL